MNDKRPQTGMSPTYRQVKAVHMKTHIFQLLYVRSLSNMFKKIWIELNEYRALSSIHYSSYQV